MFGAKTPADRYEAAAKALTKAEAAHRANLDDLYAAREARDATRLTPTRARCAKSERELQDALHAAHEAHRAYWTERRDALRDELDRASLAIAEYDALALLAGDRAPHPALRYLQARALRGHTGPNLLDQDVLATDGVPQELPDSSLLEDELGAWRPQFPTGAGKAPAGAPGITGQAKPAMQTDHRTRGPPSLQGRSQPTRHP